MPDCCGFCDICDRSFRSSRVNSCHSFYNGYVVFIQMTLVWFHHMSFKMIGSIELSFTMIALKFYALMNTESFKICIIFLNFNVILTYVCLMYDEFLIYLYLLICLSKLWRPLEALKILLQNSHLCLMPSWMPATCFLKWLCFKNFLSHCLHWCSLVP